MNRSILFHAFGIFFLSLAAIIVAVVPAEELAAILSFHL